MAADKKSGGTFFKNPLASGLNRGGRIGAWVTALGVVYAWNVYGNSEDHANFNEEERSKWNSQKQETNNS